jgi:hypothetical protein
VAGAAGAGEFTGEHEEKYLQIGGFKAVSKTVIRRLGREKVVSRPAWSDR